MTDHSCKTVTSNLDSISALRQELNRLSGLIARNSLSNSSLVRELKHRLPALQRMLVECEQELALQEAAMSELAALYGVSQAIGSSLELPQVLNEVMDQIIRLTGAERCFLMLLHPDTDELEFQAARNMDRETIASSAFEISQSIVNQVAVTGDPIVTTNAQMDPRFKKHESVIGYSLRSILCVPLKVREHVTGVIYADNRVRAGLFSDRDRDLLTTFAGQAAVAIENARLFERIDSAKTLMDSVFASITSGVITVDVQGRITFCNRAARRILQVPVVVSIGSRFADAVPALERVLYPLLEKVKSRRLSVIDFEVELPRARRSALHLRTSLSPMEDAAGETQGVAIVIDDLTEQRRLESRYEMFQRYLPPAVIERLPDDPRELKLGGNRQEITSLFADIRGFTDFSLQYDPETLVEVLNRYLDVGAKAVLAEEGTLDKFMGDAVVAFFNAPLVQPDHVLRAVRAALEMQQGILRLHRQLPIEYQLGYGAGISVGDAVVGNVGTPQRIDYTAIGPGVNLARRLQEMAAPGQTLLSRAAYDRVRGHVEARQLPPIEIEGIAEPLEVYELLGLK